MFFHSHNRKKVVLIPMAVLKTIVAYLNWGISYKIRQVYGLGSRCISKKDTINNTYDLLIGEIMIDYKYGSLLGNLDKLD